MKATPERARLVSQSEALARPTTFEMPGGREGEGRWPRARVDDVLRDFRIARNRSQAAIPLRGQCVCARPSRARMCRRVAERVGGCGGRGRVRRDLAPGDMERARTRIMREEGLVLWPRSRSAGATDGGETDERPANLRFEVTARLPAPTGRLVDRRNRPRRPRVYLPDHRLLRRAARRRGGRRRARTTS